MGKHSVERRSPLPALLSVLAVLAIAGAAFLVYRILSGANSASQAAQLPTTSATASASSTTTSTSTTTSAASAASAADAADAAATKAIQGCVDRQKAAQPALDAATTGINHWTDHLQGETDYESGLKSYIEVKTNVWGPTKAAGPGDVATFNSAMNAYSEVGGCQNVGSLQASPALAPKLQACAAREQALDAYVSTAKAVMGDWQTHLGEMADHADGHLDGPGAQARWIERWRAAPTNLSPYYAASTAWGKAPACSV